MSAPGELLISEYLSEKVKEKFNIFLSIAPGKLADCWTTEKIAEYLGKRLRFEAEGDRGDKYAVEATLIPNPEITVEDVIKGNYHSPTDLFDFKDIKVIPLAKRIENIEIDLELTSEQIAELEEQIAEAVPEGYEATCWGYKIVAWVEAKPTE